MAPPREPWTYDAVLVLGGAMNVDQVDRHPWLIPEKELLRKLLERRTPLLGVCLGAQLVAEAAGATPRRAREPEIGWLEVELTSEARGDPLLAGLPLRFDAFQWHSYEFPLPPNAVPLARSPVCLQAFRVNDCVGEYNSTPRSRSGSSRTGSPTTEATRTRCGSVSTTRLCGSGPGNRSTAGTRSDALSGGGSWNALLRSDVGAREATVDHEG